MKRFAAGGLVALAIVVLIAVLRGCHSDEALRAAEARADSLVAVSDTLRAAVDSLDVVYADSLATLAAARTRVDRRIVVVDSTRDRVMAVRDSTLDGLLALVEAGAEQDSAPAYLDARDLLPPLQRVRASIAAADSAAAERIALADRRTEIADSTASIWRTRFTDERDLRLSLEAVVEAKDAVIAELRKRTQANVFGLRLPLPGWVGDAVHVGAGVGAGYLIGRAVSR